LAVNATDGKVIWNTIPVGDPNKNYRTQGPVTVWKDIVLVGQASSSGPETPDLKGKVTAFNRTNGEKIWEFQTTVGPWIEGENATKNGGATTWTGGTLDPNTGYIMYRLQIHHPDLMEQVDPVPIYGLIL
ncbi:MAG: hypothetical protein ACJ703_11625, partial [Nitrososphaera sp.]